MLILTNYDQAKELIKSKEFDNVLSISDPFSEKFVIPENATVNYLHLQFEDDCKINIKSFTPFYNWLNSTKNNRGTTLIHCEMGISRSTACALIYLIEVENYSIQKAVQFIKNCNRYGDPYKIGSCPNLKLLKFYGNFVLIQECFKELQLFRNQYNP